jgi:3-deoxy-7-phosphoheptulonate synthase
MNLPYKLASRQSHSSDSIIRIPVNSAGARDVTIGGGSGIVMVAGPCSVESRDIMFQTAEAIRSMGAVMLRAGAFKPRTSPYSFQGLGVEGLRILIEVRERFGLPFITEVMDTRDVEMIGDVSDVLQIGARNTQNYSLLKAVGRVNKPVLLKRGISGTIEELLMSAEYIMSQGNPNVILCERGIRTYEKATRNTLDLNAVPVLKSLTHLPVAVDPSHGTGIDTLVPVMARASVAAGADLLLVEVHPNPKEATSDGAQTLDFPTFGAMMNSIGKVAAAIDRSIQSWSNAR